MSTTILTINSETGGADGASASGRDDDVVPRPMDAAADGDGANDSKGGVVGISMEELIYGASSFHAIVKPVSITLILAALAVNYVNTEETKASGEAALDQSYQVFTLSDDQSAATNLGLGLVNALVIVAVITGMTFLIVLLYKYRCVSFFISQTLTFFPIFVKDNVLFIIRQQQNILSIMFIKLSHLFSDEIPVRLYDVCISNAAWVSRRSDVHCCHQQVSTRYR